MVIGNVYRGFGVGTADEPLGRTGTPNLGAARQIAERYKIPIEWALLVEQTAARVGGYGEDLAAVIWHESHFNPQAQFGYLKGPPGGRFKPGRAVGLVQFKSSTAKALGTTDAALFRMDFEQQMNYVGKYLERVASGRWAGGEAGPLDDTYKMALSVFYPAKRNDDPDTELSKSAQDANPGISTIGQYVEKVLGDSQKLLGPSSSGIDSYVGAAFVDQVYDPRHLPLWLLQRTGYAGYRH